LESWINETQNVNLYTDFLEKHHDKPYVRRSHNSMDKRGFNLCKQSGFYCSLPYYACGLSLLIFLPEIQNRTSYRIKSVLASIYYNSKQINSIKGVLNSASLKISLFNGKNCLRREVYRISFFLFNVFLYLIAFRRGSRLKRKKHRKWSKSYWTIRYTVKDTVYAIGKGLFVLQWDLWTLLNAII